MSTEPRKQMLNVCPCLVPSGEPVYRECMPQIVQTRLISRILARDANMVSQSQECILQDTPLYRVTVLASEERIRPVAALPSSTPVLVIPGKQTSNLPIE